MIEPQLITFDKNLLENLKWEISDFQKKKKQKAKSKIWKL